MRGTVRKISPLRLFIIDLMRASTRVPFVSLSRPLNVRQLVDKIEQYVAHYNEHKRPFVWTATADSILAKVQRICKLINGTPD